MQHVDDIALARDACAGSRRAFETLVTRHYDRMFRFACQWCGDRTSAQDIVQEAAIKLARVICSFDGRAAFTSWLYRLVINCGIDWQRGQKRHAGSGGDAEAPGVAAEGSAEDALHARQVLAQVDSLPAAQRTALLLVFGQGLSHAEAAQAMEVKESTVSWYIHEARKALGVKDGREAAHG